MPFDWMHPHVPEPFTRSQSEKATAMYLAEAKYRAALLKRLGRDQETALARIRRNFEWGFELHDKPAFLNQLRDVVGQVYQH